MALACELTSVRGDRGENYENTKKHKKKKKEYQMFAVAVLFTKNGKYSVMNDHRPQIVTSIAEKPINRES